MGPTLPTLLLLFVATTSGHTMGFRLLGQNIRRNASEAEVPHRREPEPLYQAIVHLDSRPTEVLVDKLGEELRFQAGDPVSSPWPFIGGLGTVRA